MKIFLMLIIFLASLVHTLTGMGYGLVAVPLMLFFMNTTDASSLCHITGSVMIFILAICDFRKINFKILALTLSIALVSSYLGVKIMVYVDDVILKKVLGIIVVIFGIYFIFFSKKVKAKPTLPVAIIMSFLSGLLQGMVSMGGAPMAIYLLSAIDNKEEYYGTFASYFTGINIAILITRFSSGIISNEVLKLSLLGGLPIAIGIIIGKAIVKKLSIEKVKQMVYIFMLFIGTYLFIVN